MIESPSGRVLEKAQRWDLTRTEASSSGKVFLVCPLVYEEYLGIYGADIRVGGATGGPQAHRAPPRARLVRLWLTRGTSGLLPKLPTCLLVQEKSSKSFIPFGLHLVLIFCKGQKQGKNCNWHHVNRLVPKSDIK